MAFIKRTWLARIGTGLNKFIIGEKDANDKQTLVNSPDSVTQQGDVISAENLNDLEDRIETAVNANETAIQANATAIVGLKLTKIWENPNPTASMGSQNISIEALIGVNDVIVAYKMETSHLLYQRVSSRVGSGSYSLPLQYCSVSSISSRMNVASRTLSFIPSTGRLNLTDCLYAYTDGSTFNVGTMNDYLVPIAIYAVGNIYNS